MQPTVSIITTCKGRLYHLKQTLGQMMSQPAAEVVVVDYDCPDGTSAWVAANHPAAKLVHVLDPLGFSASRAKNCGAERANSEWLAFIDADNIPSADWLAWIMPRLTDGCFFVIERDPAKKQSFGLLVCRRHDFLLAGKFDEALRGWGAEDTDMGQRLLSLGLERRVFPGALIAPINHDDDARSATANLELPQLKIRSKLFLRAKEAINQKYGGMDICCRAMLLEVLAKVAVDCQSMNVYDCYPVRFPRYCPACAERLSFNMQLTLHYRPLSLFRSKRFVLTEQPIDSSRRPRIT